ncbi:MAG TPA: tol-pal system protein YbgF [Thermoanaerobaculia bacterium]|jgi:tol-pal system protein YbgF
MKKLAVLAVVLLAACTSTTDDDGAAPIIVPQPVADPALTQSVNALQTQLTELLERLDVMNSRLAQVEGGAVMAAPATTAAAPAAAPVTRRQQPAPETAGPREVAATPAGDAEPQRALIGAQLANDYREAIMLFGRGRHADARRGFEQVFASDSTGDLADNALFWIGETYFAAGDLTNAVRYYTRVVNEFSDQNKAPDALFKTALAQARTGDLALARRTLQQVIERYPYSSTASSAKAELQRIKF